MDRERNFMDWDWHRGKEWRVLLFVFFSTARIFFSFVKFLAASVAFRSGGRRPPMNRRAED